MGLDISVISEMEPIEIPEDIELHGLRSIMTGKRNKICLVMYGIYTNQKHFTEQV